MSLHGWQGYLRIGWSGKCQFPRHFVFLGPLYPLPMPWHRYPSSFEYDWFHVFLYLGWRSSWKCSRVSPVTLSMTGMAHLRINAPGNCRWDACWGIIPTCCESPFGSVYDGVWLSTGLWPSWVGVAGSGKDRGHGVDWHARVRWEMGSSMSFSVLLFVSVGGIMTTLGD